MGRAPTARADARRNARLPSGVSSLRAVSFLNGNTFGEIARRVIDAIFIEFPLGRRREAASLLCLDSKTGGRSSAFCILHSAFVLGFALTPKPGGGQIGF